MGSIYVNYSDISCGVHQMFGFQNFSQRAKISTICRAVFFAIRSDYDEHAAGEPQAGETLRPCNMYMFSDVAGKNATRFANYIRETWPNQNIVCVSGKNPNSGNTIEAYIWQPDLSQLMAHPQWARAMREYANIGGRYNEDRDWF